MRTFVRVSKITLSIISLSFSGSALSSTFVVPSANVSVGMHYAGFASKTLWYSGPVIGSVREHFSDNLVARYGSQLVLGLAQSGSNSAGNMSFSYTSNSGNLGVSSGNMYETNMYEFFFAAIGPSGAVPINVESYLYAAASASGVAFSGANAYVSIPGTAYDVVCNVTCSPGRAGSFNSSIYVEANVIYSLQLVTVAWTEVFDGSASATAMAKAAITLGSGVNSVSLLATDVASLGNLSSYSLVASEGVNSGPLIASLDIGVVPEPSMWLELLCGFFAIGYLLRLRENVVGRHRFANP